MHTLQSEAIEKLCDQVILNIILCTKTKSTFQAQIQLEILSTLSLNPAQKTQLDLQLCSC